MVGGRPARRALEWMEVGVDNDFRCREPVMAMHTEDGPVKVTVSVGFRGQSSALAHVRYQVCKLNALWMVTAQKAF